jgi:hypothetical protein
VNYAFDLSALFYPLCGVGGGWFWECLWKTYRKKTLKWIKYTMPMSLDCARKAYQQEPLHLKERSVLLGINRLKNTSQSCVVEMHL